MRGEIERAVVSVGPPAGYGTTTRMALDGKRAAGCANTVAGSNSSALMPSVTIRKAAQSQAALQANRYKTLILKIVN